MEISISDEKENKLFGRKEISFTATYSGSKTPSKEEIKQEICKKLSLHPELTTVIKVTQAFGRNSSEVLVRSYSKKETMERLERQPKKDAKAAQAAAPAPKAAAPAKAEEKKEAPKEEKKEEAK